MASCNYLNACASRVPSAAAAEISFQRENAVGGREGAISQEEVLRRRRRRRSGGGCHRGGELKGDRKKLFARHGLQ